MVTEWLARTRLTPLGHINFIIIIMLVLQFPFMEGNNYHYNSVPMFFNNLCDEIVVTDFR